MKKSIVSSLVENALTKESATYTEEGIGDIFRAIYDKWKSWFPTTYWTVEAAEIGVRTKLAGLSRYGAVGAKYQELITAGLLGSELALDKLTTDLKSNRQAPIVAEFLTKPLRYINTLQDSWRLKRGLGTLTVYHDLITLSPEIAKFREEALRFCDQPLVKNYGEAIADAREAIRLAREESSVVRASIYATSFVKRASRLPMHRYDTKALLKSYMQLPARDLGSRAKLIEFEADTLSRKYNILFDTVKYFSASKAYSNVRTLMYYLEESTWEDRQNDETHDYQNEKNLRLLWALLGKDFEESREQIAFELDNAHTAMYCYRCASADYLTVHRYLLEAQVAYIEAVERYLRSVTELTLEGFDDSGVGYHAFNTPAGYVPPEEIFVSEFDGDDALLVDEPVLDAEAVDELETAIKDSVGLEAFSELKPALREFMQTSTLNNLAYEDFNNPFVARTTINSLTFELGRSVSFTEEGVFGKTLSAFRGWLVGLRKKRLPKDFDENYVTVLEDYEKVVSDLKKIQDLRDVGIILESSWLAEESRLERIGKGLGIDLDIQILCKAQLGELQKYLGGQGPYLYGSIQPGTKMHKFYEKFLEMTLKVDKQVPVIFSGIEAMRKEGDLSKLAEVLDTIFTDIGELLGSTEANFRFNPFWDELERSVHTPTLEQFTSDLLAGKFAHFSTRGKNANPVWNAEANALFGMGQVLISLCDELTHYGKYIRSQSDEIRESLKKAHVLNSLFGGFETCQYIYYDYLFDEIEMINIKGATKVGLFLFNEYSNNNDGNGVTTESLYDKHLEGKREIVNFARWDAALKDVEEKTPKVPFAKKLHNGPLSCSKEIIAYNPKANEANGDYADVFGVYSELLTECGANILTWYHDTGIVGEWFRGYMKLMEAIQHKPSVTDDEAEQLLESTGLGKIVARYDEGDRWYKLGVKQFIADFGVAITKLKKPTDPWVIEKGIFVDEGVAKMLDAVRPSAFSIHNTLNNPRGAGKPTVKLWMVSNQVATKYLAKEINAEIKNINAAVNEASRLVEAYVVN